MAVLRYIAPALAVASGAIAQSCGSSSATTTIQSNADATGLSGCSTYSGSIAIATGTTDSIMFSGIKKITGNLVANNVTGMAAFGATDLEQIGGEFNLEQLTILSSLTFPALVKVDSIMWTALPALGGLSFTEGLQEINMLSIDNTFLNSLDGIDLQVADTFTVTNNPYLTSVNMQLGNVTTSLTLGANGKNLSVEFPNLEWAYNMTFRECSEVSIPSLASINGSLGFYSDDFENLSAPNLTNVGGTLSIISCDAVTNVSMPELTTVGGGLQINNNTELAKVNGFPQLKTIGGAVDMNGAFTDVELPGLAKGNVRGAFNLQSTKDISNACSTFSALSGNSAPIKGKFTCAGENPSATGGNSTSSDSGSGSSSSSSAAHPILIPGATGLLGVVAAIFGLL